MASKMIDLPKGDTMARLMHDHAQRARWADMPRMTAYKVVYDYLNGARRFQVRWEDGFVKAYDVDEEGNLEFRSGDMLRMGNEVAAALMSGDMSPRVAGPDRTLGSVRNRAVAQVLADSMYKVQQIEDVKGHLATMFTYMGSAGLISNVEQDKVYAGLNADLEIVHPSEILPFPLLGYDMTKQRGLMRERWVTLEEVVEVFGKKFKRAENLAMMEVDEVTAGQIVEVLQTGPEGFYSEKPNLGHASGRMADPKETEKVYVLVRELWLTGSCGRCVRYVASSGDKILVDEDYGDLDVACPLAYERFLETGGFRGAGLFELVFSSVRQFELMMKDLANNVHELDRYGFVVLPQGSFNERTQLREVGKGLKALFYEPDTYLENFKPFTVAPSNTGDVPGRTAAFFQDYLKGLSPIRDIIAEKGRVDSATGLGFLKEEASRAMTHPNKGFQALWSKAYRGGVAKALNGMVSGKFQTSVAMDRLSLDLAGVVVDWQEGTVDLGQNMLPNLSQVTFGVKEATPKSKVQRKEEALQLLEMQVSDPLRLELLAIEEDLDLALWNTDRKEAYNATVRRILQLFNDGQTAGEVVMTPEMGNMEVSLMVVKAFMNTTKFSLASPEVQDEFQAWFQTMTQWGGRSLPEGVPYNMMDVAVASQGGEVPPIQPPMDPQQEV